MSSKTPTYSDRFLKHLPFTNPTYTMKTIIFCLCMLMLLKSGFAQYPNIRVSSASSSDPNETSISINPTNPKNLIAGANIWYYYTSNDGGHTWTQQNLTSSFTVWGDPVVIFDAQGHAYYGHLTNPSGPAFIDRIVVQKSTDGGVSWSDGAGIGFNSPKQQDKEWLAADMTGSFHHGNIYMAWTEFDSYGSADPSDSSRILFVRSTNGGASWSVPVKINEVSGDCIDDDNTTEGAVPAVGPNGEVYIAWSGPAGIVFDRSTDGGTTFGNDIFVDGQPGGWAFEVDGIYRCNGLPVTACDVSSSAYRGRIYVLWADQRNGTGNTDVFLRRSDDGGDTWLAPVRVNNDNSNREQFFPWMTIDPATGYCYVVFYDRRNTSGTSTEVWMAKSTDGGSTFSNFKVSESAFTPNQQVFFGDYNGIAALDGQVYPMWTRMVSSSRSVWIALVNDVPQITSALRDTILPANFGKRFITRLHQHFADNDNPAPNYSAAVLSGSLQIDLIGDSLYLVSEPDFHGDALIKVQANDGVLTALDTFLVHVGSYQAARITLAALASPVVNVVRFTVASDSLLTNATLTVNGNDVPLEYQHGLYVGDVVLTQAASLAVHFGSMDLHGYAASIDRSYTVARLDKPLKFGEYEFRGQTDGFVLITQSEHGPIPVGWQLLTLPIEITTTGSTGVLEVSVQYLVPAHGVEDESKVGLFREMDGKWIDAGGVGYDGKLETTLPSGGRIAVMIDPNRVATPTRFLLRQNFPNPFNPATTIRFDVPFPSTVTIEVYNLLGQKVRVIDTQARNAGIHSVVWDGKDQSGRQVSSGLYLARLKSGDVRLTRKMLLIR